MKIKNRIVEYPNRVILNVLNVTRNNSGEISSIQAEISKDEGEIYEAGFALNEKNLNLILNKYYCGELSDTWTTSKYTSEFIIDVVVPVNVNIEFDDLQSNCLSWNAIQSNNELHINISKVDDFIISSSNTFKFKIKLTDSSTNTELGTVNAQIDYITSSEVPQD